MNNIYNRISQLGHLALSMIRTIGQAGIFLILTCWRTPSPKKLLTALITQLFSIGVLSIVIIVVSAAFIGMVVSLQGYNTLEKFAAEGALGQLLALSVVRELGPVVAALLFAGRAGTALTAEVGLMKATEQLSAMEMIGVDPLGRIIFPRILAGFIALPLLTCIFDAVAIFSGYIGGVYWLGVDSGIFWSGMQSAVDFRIDVVSGLIKSVVFGFFVTVVALFQGYSTVPTSEGIGRATTKTVVYSSLIILGLDFVLTTMMLEGW